MLGKIAYIFRGPSLGKFTPVTSSCKCSGSYRGLGNRRRVEMPALERSLMTCKTLGRIIDQEKQTGTQNKLLKRKNIVVFGDSILNGFEEHDISKHHSVEVHPDPGAATRDIVDHVKPVARKRPDMLLIHCGTNDITSNTDTSKHLKEIVSTVREMIP